MKYTMLEKGLFGAVPLLYFLDNRVMFLLPGKVIGMIVFLLWPYNQAAITLLLSPGYK